MAKKEEEYFDELDYEKIVIYPMDIDEKNRKKLLEALKKLKVHYTYEYY